MSIPGSILQVFYLFFTREILQHIVEQSNIYAKTCMMEERYSQWQIITIEELQAYMGFMILMGIVRLPALDDYRKVDEVFHYAP